MNLFVIFYLTVWKKNYHLVDRQIILFFLTVRVYFCQRFDEMARTFCIFCLFNLIFLQFLQTCCNQITSFSIEITCYGIKLLHMLIYKLCFSVARMLLYKNYPPSKSGKSPESLQPRSSHSSLLWNTTAFPSDHRLSKDMLFLFYALLCSRNKQETVWRRLPATGANTVAGKQFCLEFSLHLQPLLWWLSHKRLMTFRGGELSCSCASLLNCPRSRATTLHFSLLRWLSGNKKRSFLCC